MSYQSTKTIELGSVAFRQWRATHSHCQFIHGYQLTAKLWFDADNLDDRNWVQDFGGLKEIRKELKDHFDHKTIVAEDDPQLELFKKLHENKIVQLVIFKNGVGCEKFAELVGNVVNQFVKEQSNNRVRCVKCEVFEHQDNSAIFFPEAAVISDYEDKQRPKKDETPIVSTTNPQVDNPKAARVGSHVTTGLGGLFEGTRLG